MEIVLRDVKAEAFSIRRFHFLIVLLSAWDISVILQSPIAVRSPSQIKDRRVPWWLYILLNRCQGVISIFRQWWEIFYHALLSSYSQNKRNTMLEKLQTQSFDSLGYTWFTLNTPTFYLPREYKTQAIFSKNKFNWWIYSLYTSKIQFEYLRLQLCKHIATVSNKGLYTLTKQKFTYSQFV